MLWYFENRGDFLSQYSVIVTFDFENVLSGRLRCFENTLFRNASCLVAITIKCKRGVLCLLVSDFIQYEKTIRKNCMEMIGWLVYESCEKEFFFILLGPVVL